MIGDSRPGRAAVNLYGGNGKAANVDAIQAQHGQSGWEAARRTATGEFEHFLQLQALSQHRACFSLPVVENTRHDQQRIGWHQLFDAFTYGGKLLAPAPGE